MSIANILKKLNSRNTILLPKFTKKNKFIFVLITLVYVTFISRQVFAALSSETVDAFMKKQEAVNGQNNQESWIREAAISNIMVLNNSLAGDIDKEVLLGANTQWVPGGIIGFTSNSIARLYNPPISGIQYISQSINNFFGKPAVAATTGYEALYPIQILWKGFRDVSYVLFSIIFIIIGIMIMLRVKISQQAVLTMQSAIPKLVTSLIFITFSYAIVGLLIDLSFVIEALGISIIQNSIGNKTTFSLTEIINNPNLFEDLNAMVPISLIIRYLAVPILIMTIIKGPFSLLAFAFIFLAIWIFVLITLIKFFFGLAKCYVTVIFKTIVAPLEIALGAIPNMKIGFGTWFIDIFANILVFPISMIFITFIKTIISTISLSSNEVWVPSGVSVINQIASVGTGGNQILPIALGVAGLMLISKLPQLIPELIFQIKPSPWGKAIGEGLAPYSKAASIIPGSALEAGGQYAQIRGARPNSGSLWKGGKFIADQLEARGFIKGTKIPPESQADDN